MKITKRLQWNAVCLMSSLVMAFGFASCGTSDDDGIIDADSGKVVEVPEPDTWVTDDDMERFGHDFVLQTMFLRAPGFDSSSPEVLGPWMDIVRRLRPREVMVYTLDRPTPAEGLQKFTAAEMQALVQPLIDEGIKIQIKG